MRLLADLHIHSPYSRATSKALSLEMLYVWAQKKGLGLVGTGDFTHPLWQKQILEKLKPAWEEGLWILKPELASSVLHLVPEPCRGDVRFVLQTEISTIYKQEGKTRKVHHLVLLPDRISMERLTWSLERIGNLSADGRPILGLSSRDLLEVVLEACEEAIFIAAHIWTPWFSVFGSRSGFDELSECYGDLTKNLTALETGLSSDPSMNYRWSRLDGFTLVSNSDAHSASNLGREANLLDIQPSFRELKEALKNGKGFLGTIEFFPEEGKYHWDGHRACGVRMEPRTSLANQGLCPRCRKPLTIGVLHRVEELSDRPPGVVPQGARPYWRLIPLQEVLAEILGCGANSRKVGDFYEMLLSQFGPELPFLMDPPIGLLEQRNLGVLATALKKMKEGDVILEPGYDGQYGQVRLFSEDELFLLKGQMSLLKPGPEVTAEVPCEEGGRIREVILASAPRSLEDQPQGTSSGCPLDCYQRRAVEHRGRALLVIAGPGTGKTRVLAHRVARLLEGCKDGKVLALTFTQRAALEMKERLQDMLGTEWSQEDLNVGTIHAWGLSFLRENWAMTGLSGPPYLADEDQRKMALDRARGQGEKIPKDPQRALEVISAIKQGLAPEKQASMKQVLFLYDSALRAEGLVDYDDLLGLPLRILREYPDIRGRLGISHLLIDEFQDLNPLQLKLIEALITPRTYVTFIGDPDQSIYGFRGAAPQAMLDATAKIPGTEVVALPTNYRSKAEIVQGASALISQNRPFFQRSLLPYRAPGEGIRVAVFESRKQEAIFVAHEIERLIGGMSHLSMRLGMNPWGGEELGLGFGDVAVLARIHSLLPEIEEALLKQGIPCQRWGGWDGSGPSQARVIYGHLRWLLGDPNPLGARVLKPTAELEDLKSRVKKEAPPSVVAQVFQAVTGFDPHGPLPLQDIDPRAMRLLDSSRGWKGDLRGFVDCWSLLLEEDQPLPRRDAVCLMTVHGAKGLEFSVVFVVGCEEGIFPWRQNGLKGNIEEERRLFYVAMTRAKDVLYLTMVRNRAPGLAPRGRDPSRFLKEIPQQLLINMGERPKSRGPRQLTLF